jgi:hypothetical protein
MTGARRRFLCVLCATMAAPIAGACGGKSAQQATTSAQPVSKSQYERKVTDIQQAAFAKANPATILGSSASGNPATGIAVVQRVTASEADELSRIPPPADIAGPHGRLVDAIRAYARDLGAMTRALRDHQLDPGAIPAKLRSLPSVRAVRAARAAIIDKGYRIG